MKENRKNAEAEKEKYSENKYFEKVHNTIVEDSNSEDKEGKELLFHLCL